MSQTTAPSAAPSEQLGIIGVHSVHFMVANPERSHTFYTERFGYAPTWRADEATVARTGQRSTVYQAGDIRVAVSSPAPGNTTCRAARWLRRNPAAVGSLSFEVEDIERTWNFLAGRGGTFIHAIRETRLPDGGRFRHFSITTAIGDVTFRFVQRDDTEVFAPGFDATGEKAENPFGFSVIDHFTANGQSLAPMTLWFEHVLGFQKFWDIEFHTEDVKEGGKTGTGLRSHVYWDPRSGVKFPFNEPLAPFFKEGQINRYIEDNHGAGIQHIACRVDDVVSTVDAMRARGVQFLDTPGSYYDQSPRRLASFGVNVDHLQPQHALANLRPRGILIDGSPGDQYLVQIFLRDAMNLYGDKQAGPFFFELIERVGDQGFGGGNFRALFEAIERDQLGE